MLSLYLLNPCLNSNINVDCDEEHWTLFPWIVSKIGFIIFTIPFFLPILLTNKLSFIFILLNFIWIYLLISVIIWIWSKYINNKKAIVLLLISILYIIYAIVQIIAFTYIPLR